MGQLAQGGEWKPCLSANTWCDWKVNQKHKNDAPLYKCRDVLQKASVVSLQYTAIVVSVANIF